MLELFLGLSHWMGEGHWANLLGKGGQASVSYCPIAIRKIRGLAFWVKVG